MDDIVKRLQAELHLRKAHLAEVDELSLGPTSHAEYVLQEGCIRALDMAMKLVYEVSKRPNRLPR